MWFQLFVLIGLQLLSFILAPKPKVQNAVAATEVQANVATNEVGREIPVLFGSKVIKNPLIAWYGNLSAVPNRKKSGKKG